MSKASGVSIMWIVRNFGVRCGGKVGDDRVSGSEVEVSG
jgi:hypothetical protein